MEAAIDFKSLRAKFQESNQLKDRPVVLDKPKRFPPLASRANSLTNSSTEDKILTNLRDEQKLLSGKWPSATPSCYCPTDTNGIGSDVRRRSFKDRHLPLVLPASSSSTSSSNILKQEATSSSKLVTSPIKCKKKVMPTPFKPAKFSKSIKDILNNAEHPESSKPQSERYTMENGVSPQNGGSHSGSSCPSPDQPSSPSPTGEDQSNGGSFPYVLSTLERAKKKFSPKNLLVYTRPKSFYSSKESSESPSPPAEYGNFHTESSSLTSGYQAANSPTRNLPQTNGINHRPVLHLNGDMKPVQPGACAPPLIKVLPNVTSLAPLPKKPARPPHVDLSAYRTQKLEKTVKKASTNLVSGSGSEGPEAVAAENAPVPPPPQFDVPHFQDFASSVLETINPNVINVSSLETEATDLSATPPGPEEGCDGSLHNDEVEMHGTGPAEPGDWNLQGSSLGHMPDSQSIMALEAQLMEAVTSEITMHCPQNLLTDSYVSNELPSEPSIIHRDDNYEVCDNVYEEVEAISRFNFGHSSRKRKETPKNPYAESPGKDENRKSVWHVAQGMGMNTEASGMTPPVWDSAASVRKDRLSPDHQEEKEARKREKQRLEREKKEQKEKEKRENEMKKKFKITGQEEPMYHARVLLASKLRKHDLQVKSGDTVSIIRTTNCPKGKWLARDSQNKYGYISVMNVELNMKEMLELGKRASQAIGRGHGEGDTLSLSSRSSYYNPVLTSSFTDDSEEWSGDEETMSHSVENMSSNRAVSMPDMFKAIACNRQARSDGSVEDVPSHVNHEALHKLAVFFQNNKDELNTVTETTDLISTKEEDQFSFTDVDLLPPPELYADSS